MINKSARYYPFDKIIIGYCLLTIAFIIIFGRPLTEYFYELTVYLVAAGIAVSVPLIINESQSRYAAGVRFLYPVILFAVFYRTTGGTMFLLFDHFLDNQLVAFETAIYGIEPTLYIDKNLLNPIINEIFSFCYFCYYFMMTGFLISVFVKKDYEIIKPALTALAITFAVSFLLFFLCPIEGPRWHFAGQYLNTIDGYLFRHLVEMVIESGAVRGGCMPSSHIAIALVIMFYCFKNYRLWGWILLPINIGLAIGTFWGRFHYVSDVLVGIAIAIGAYLLVEKKYLSWTQRGYKELNKEEVKAKIVT